ncbi:MAG: cell division protein FtsQ/DivIB [Bacteroidaceae bacterium]|nr:cell division protein FtsQ/DivIB [Bacteroidaceae bacterium]
MKKSSVIKTIVKLLVLLGLAAYLVFALVKFNRPSQSPECTGLDIIIEDEQSTNFVNENEIRTLLVGKQLFPEGKAMDDIDLTQMEAALTASPYINEALCFKTAEHHVAIHVTPRVPVLHVINNQNQDFYIDNNKGTMPRGHHVVDLLVMTGYVPRETAGPLYSAMGMRLGRDPFWNKEIQEIHVREDGDIELTPRVGDFTILLGDTSQLDDKLQRMRQFYTDGLDKAGWNRYKVINLKFQGQIVAERRDTK